MKSYHKKFTAAGLLLVCLLLIFTACGGNSSKPIPPEVTDLTWTMTNAILGDPENQNIPRDVYTAPDHASADAGAEVLSLTCTGGDDNTLIFTNTVSGEQWTAACGQPELTPDSRFYSLTFDGGQTATAIAAVTTYYDADRNESYEYTLIVAFPPDSGIPEFHFSAPVEE